MVLDTTSRLTEAIALYESVGFTRMPPQHAAPEGFDEHLLFLGRDL